MEIWIIDVDVVIEYLMYTILFCLVVNPGQEGIGLYLLWLGKKRESKSACSGLQSFISVDYSTDVSQVFRMMDYFLAIW